MFQFINFKIINRFFYFIQLIIILLWCNISLALDLSNVTNFFKTQNNPPTELFGIKLFENINNYTKETILFQNLEDVYDDFENPFFEKIKYFNANDVVKIKNPNFDSYTLYLNEKLQITGISGDNYENPFKQDHNLQKCLLKKNELVVKISNLYNLNTNNFKEQNYMYKTDVPDYETYKNDIASSLDYKFDNNEIKLTYSLSCYLDSTNEESVLYIDLSTEELNDAIWIEYMSKTEKSVDQLLNKDKDLKGF